MKNVLGWIRSNVITTVAIAIVLVALTVVWMTRSGSAALRAKMMEVKSPLDKLNSARSTPVTIPPKTPDGKPQSIVIPINRASIDKLKEAYERMSEEYIAIRKLTIDFNEGTDPHKHSPIVNGLFPDTGDDLVVPYNARDRFSEQFSEMLRTVGVGQRQTSQELDDKVTELKREFLSRNFTPPRKLSDEKDLTDAERAKMDVFVNEGLVKYMQDHAKGFHVYVDNLAVGAVDYPIHVPPYLLNPAIEKLKMHQFWELQMVMWIQQDILRAIAMTNRSGAMKSNVINSPIKRLLKMRVADGYVGINAPGAIRVGTQKFEVGTNKGEDERSRAILAARDERRLPENFNDSPTGRISNKIYDVRHVTLSMIVDYEDLPLFIENLARVNFMTVLSMQVTDVDEYQALRDRFVYGTGDAAQVDMVIETIWLREWTSQYMPDSVKLDLGVATEKTVSAGG